MHDPLDHQRITDDRSDVPKGASVAEDVLAQYGAIGFIALLALAAVRVLFQREVKAHELDAARADRLEAELKSLNETVRTQYITTLTQATLAMSEAFDVIREVGESDSQSRGKGRKSDRGSARSQR
jgi:hypothetical protein